MDIRKFKSENYSKIRDRLIHLVPNYSYVGVLLRNDKELIFGRLSV